MKIAVISDIHGNLEAFKTATKLIASLSVDEVVCLGDIVGYGADPNECVERIRSMARIVVRGNHDAAVVDPSEIAYFNPVAAAAIRWTARQLTDENRAYLESLPLVAAEYGCTFVHSSPFHPERWEYITDPAQTVHLSQTFSTPLCFIGHTHVPGIFTEGTTLREIGRTGKYIVNVGSVGQPRDGNPDLCFALLDTDTWTVTHIRDKYDIETAARKIIEAGLPPVLAERLGRGI